MILIPILIWSAAAGIGAWKIVPHHAWKQLACKTHVHCKKVALKTRPESGQETKR